MSEVLADAPQVEAPNLPYFKSGESCTVEAVVNGFVVHTEDGQFICGDPQQMVQKVLVAVTNHEAFAEAQKQTAKTEIEDDELDSEPEAAD